jgi:uncharacterized DUF497 family protein
VFDDPNCLTFLERVEDGEERWHAIGVLDGRAAVTVVHTHRPDGSGEIIRIVSARRADAQERNMPKLSDRQREDILAVTDQRDEDIDYSDIPRFGKSRQMPFVAGSIPVMPLPDR